MLARRPHAPEAFPLFTAKAFVLRRLWYLAVKQILEDPWGVLGVLSWGIEKIELMRMRVQICNPGSVPSYITINRILCLTPILNA